MKTINFVARIRDSGTSKTIAIPNEIIVNAGYVYQFSIQKEE